MISGAILVIGNGSEGDIDTDVPANRTRITDGPLSCCEVLGRSPLERTIERMRESGIERISLLAESGAAQFLPSFRTQSQIDVQSVGDCLFGVTQKLEQFCSEGVNQVFIAAANVYAECDYHDFLHFHRERRQPITRARDLEGDLDLWLVDCSKARHIGISDLLSRDATGDYSYSVRDYVNRLAHPADVRRLVVDAFHRRCEIRPDGSEIRPGVWIDSSAEVHRRTRIVAPAFIGAGCKISEDTLITRYSNVESWSHIDYGTVLENSSVLSNSYVGIWLDVSHAVVSGSRLMNLTRNVVLELSDPSIIRKNTVVSKIVRRDKALVSRLMAFASSE